jgi:predicted nuclease of predicted toxin-antitoxin system
VKLLLDMNLPPSLTATLRSAGFSAVHWLEVGDPHAADTIVLDWAQTNGHILVTHDLDFGALLADGALVTVSPSESRVRVLPLRRG